MTMWLLYAATGLLAGYLGGLLGLGGGVVLVPALYFIFQHGAFSPISIMHAAIGTSFATATITAIAATRAHHRRGAVRWDLVQKMLIGIVTGTALGCAIAAHLPAQGLRSAFGVFECLVALQLLSDWQPVAVRGLPKLPGLTAAGALIGGVSAFFGIGGGSMTVPFLAWCRVPFKQAVATSSACGVPITLAGAAGYVISGLAVNDIPAPHAGYIYLPAWLMTAIFAVFAAPCGARTAHALSTPALRHVFAAILFIIGIKMIWG